MLIVDAFTGREGLKVGDVVRTPHDDGPIRIDAIREGFLSAELDFTWMQTGLKVTIPLQVRFLHPDFLFRKVGFIPS